MDMIKRIHQIIDERNWTEYRLAKRCNLPSSTLTNMFKRGTMPSLSTIEQICAGLGITLCQFFDATDEAVAITQEQKSLLIEWSKMTKDQRKSLLALIQSITNEK